MELVFHPSGLASKLRNTAGKLIVTQVLSPSPVSGKFFVCGMWNSGLWNLASGILDILELSVAHRGE